MIKIIRFVTVLYLFFLIFGLPSIFAGITGKITGRVSDAESGEPLVGANVVVEGTYRGSATDLDGEFLILNVTPGIYSVTFSIMGYQSITFDRVGVSIDRTTSLNAELNPTLLEAAPAVTLVMKKPVVKQDLTSSEAMVGAEQIEMMPVENFGDIVNLQAGVVDGHFRGGRSSEVTYMIDGVMVSDPYSDSDPFDRTTSNQVENNAIQEIQVISGTFNAEYGQAMSGIVNIVTKEGSSEKYSGKASIGVGDYVSDRSIAVGLYDDPPDEKTFMDDLNPGHLQDYQLSLSGPVYPAMDNLTFFASGRFLNDHGRIYGQRIFTPSDSNDFSHSNQEDWYIENSGDNELVTMDSFEKISGQMKLTYRLTPSQKISYSVIADQMEYKELSTRDDDPEEEMRLFKYNPDGQYINYSTGMNHQLTWDEILNKTTFYTVNLSYTRNDHNYYVNENVADNEKIDRLNDALNRAFYTGGQGMWHQYRSTQKAGIKSDVTHQATKLHEMKAGVDLNQYLLTLEEYQLVWDEHLNNNQGGFKINPITSWNNNQYPEKEAESLLGGFPFSGPGHRPLIFAGYVQDKMEYDFMVVNFGIRYDFFQPDGLVPDDPADPHNDVFTTFDENGLEITGLDPVNPQNPDGTYNSWRYKYHEAESHQQLSPRIGLAFPLSAQGVVHFSYGHFFQTPPFQFLYFNPEFEVLPGLMSSKIGNAELKPEKTVMYEVGMQMEIADGIGLNVTGFYKDIRNLLGVEIQKTYDQRKYARYVNRDYGNVRGVTTALDKRMANMVGLSLDYTFQVAEGNTSDPENVFKDNKADPPRESAKKVLPLDWDQSHTFNAGVNIGVPGDWSVGLIGTIGTGLPYTSQPFLQPRGETNAERRPMKYNMDLKAYKMFNVSGYKPTVSLSIYNLFDIQNEKDVFVDTGRATYTLDQLQAFSVQGYNTLEDFYTRPEYFEAPRQVKLTLSVGF
ncbi:MAG: TonB-dependent receptor [Candidatus Electryonea clarkiae]|nr:TonB-dependent receptor [Candidatus Electryonea clarkiae]MDP8289334.1 TonB-dependent receptor [Candidatus Electryonea clarkiae]